LSPYAGRARELSIDIGRQSRDREGGMEVERESDSCSLKPQKTQVPKIQITSSRVISNFEWQKLNEALKI